MIKRSISILGLVLLTQLAPAQTPIDVKGAFAFAAQQYEGMLQSHPDTTKFPQSTNPDGSPRDMKSSWWCSGFFGGSLWYLFEQTGDPKWKDAAHKWTMAVAKEQHNTGTHDLGFMLYCPFGNGYRLTKNPQYRTIMLTGAQSLSTRFRPDYGVIKSWNSFKDKAGEKYDYPVIIDNMMNLEFLFWAARESGDKRLRDLSVTHANQTLKNHFRPDASSYHVICYGDGGKVLARRTHQGYADESAWARGQAWALYGYTTMYRETKDKTYLQQAQRIADFFLNHPNLPADKIPYWDFNAPGIPNEERDASAGAIASSALLELSTYGGPSAKKYYQSAVQMLESLSGPAYRAKVGENNHFILKHSVGHKPGKSEIDVPLVYADYYYLEALLRYDALRKKRS
ncbi:MULTISPECIES: glycoside hydrolase family 88 protein [Spirosoma]|uniref:Glucuronyl hydrolase n=1 Tax=Spirosoma sordidisoli TaxID=2502893 RepID=A0A4Q2ULT8_9BACT|nr:MULTISPECIES: glycoside hydrolase family 88 protein [Spirosoma]RYC70206.1 glucuronyl hydrolase [Spirosoma sordidisoli]